MMEPIQVRESIRLVPTWEAAARIFSQNLLYGVDESVKTTSAEELIKMGKQLDRYIAEQKETKTKDNS